MKELLLQQALIVDPSSQDNGKRRDILIAGGKIAAIDTKIAADCERMSGDGLAISPGWVDMRANFWDPGSEYKEDIESGSEAAMYGGFTTVALLPETDPEISTKSEVEYIKMRASGKPVTILPWASLKQRHETLQLSEMRDLSEAGAIGFSSGYSSVATNGFLVNALLYAKPLGLPVMLFAENKGLAGKGQINEGLVSVSLGIKGSPVLAEEVEVSNILALARYTGTSVHISCISAAETIDLIKRARKEGLKVTADVSVHHLYFDENDVEDFNTSLKLRPPLRTVADKKALRKAVENEEFLSVVTDHTPHEEDRKKCEFELAEFGATGLQTCFSELLAVYGPAKIDTIINALAIRPRYVLGLPVPQLKEGAKANFTIFDLNIEWQLDDKTNRSKSRNSPLWNKRIKGKAIAIANNGVLKKLVN